MCFRQCDWLCQMTLGCLPEHPYRHLLLCSPVVWHQNKVSASLYYSYPCNYVNKGKLVLSNDIWLFLSLDFSKQMHRLARSRCSTLIPLLSTGASRTDKNWMFPLAALTDKDLELGEWWLYPFIDTLLQSQRTSLQDCWSGWINKVCGFDTGDHT